MGERMGLSGSELIEFVDRKEKEYTEREERMLRRDEDRRRFEAQEAEKKRLYEEEQAEKKRLFEIERLREERALKEQELEMFKIKADAGALGDDKGAEHHNNLALFLKERVAKSRAEITQLAEQYIEAHGGTITPNRVLKNNFSSNRPPQRLSMTPSSQPQQRERPAFKKPAYKDSSFSKDTG
ncbi:uncharacterized protein LOC128558263 [Mercenaria mercenaria]|uniref:uncharacterized protein LOC128558263 n=1 Tax=Mercenaria mercenaria TaxID=6596 RepID=UPI00234F3706|nr:uncharacterized protein LOC128558263 [Mercenaria mercenaria]